MPEGTVETVRFHFWIGRHPADGTIHLLMDHFDLAFVCHDKELSAYVSKAKFTSARTVVAENAAHCPSSGSSFQANSYGSPTRPFVSRERFISVAGETWIGW
jgi:hypothetical protein